MFFIQSMQKESGSFGKGMSFFKEQADLFQNAKEVYQGFTVEVKKWYDTSIWVYSVFF